MERFEKKFGLTSTQTAVIALIVANIIWGAAPPIFKWTLQEIGPFTLAFLRFFIAALILLPFTAHNLKIEKKDLPIIFLVAFLGITVNITFFFLGLQYAPSINASIIGSAGPVFLILASIFYLKEKLKKKVIIGAHIGLLGVLIIMFKPLLSGANLSLVGNSYYFLGLLGSLGQTILGRKIMQKYTPSSITFWSFFIGAITFFPFVWGEVKLKGASSIFAPHALLGILFGALLSSALAYFLFFWSLKYLPAAETGVFVYLDPLVTVAIAIPLLGEFPDALYLLGALFVFLGIYIAEGRIHYHPFHKLRLP